MVLAGGSQHLKKISDGKTEVHPAGLVYLGTDLLEVPFYEERRGQKLQVRRFWQGRWQEVPIGGGTPTAPFGRDLASQIGDRLFAVYSDVWSENPRSWALEVTRQGESLSARVLHLPKGFVPLLGLSYPVFVDDIEDIWIPLIPAEDSPKSRVRMQAMASPGRSGNWRIARLRRPISPYIPDSGKGVGTTVEGKTYVMVCGIPARGEGEYVFPVFQLNGEELKFFGRPIWLRTNGGHVCGTGSQASKWLGEPWDFVVLNANLREVHLFRIERPVSSKRGAR
jgi:hypothetical protein